MFHIMQMKFLCLAIRQSGSHRIWRAELRDAAVRKGGLAKARPSSFQDALIGDNRSPFTNSAFPLAAPPALCQDHQMKQFLLGYLLWATIIPTFSMAQTAQLTQQLGKTVLYGDIALSPDGSRVAWVQSTAATPLSQTKIQATSVNSSAAAVKLEAAGERIDTEPVWSPDSKTLAVFSSAGEKEQRQLWSVNADGSNPRKLTQLKGYAARPRWSHDGKQIAFFYIENGGGGGPLMAAPATTGVIDTAI